MSKETRLTVLLALILLIATFCDIDGVNSLPLCAEDASCWDWETMGNKMAGDLETYETKWGDITRSFREFGIDHYAI